MRRLLAAALALGLAACATAPVTEAQGLAASWASLDAAAKVVDGLATSGALTGKSAATAAADLNEAVTILTAANAAYDAGDASTTEGDIAQATTLIAAIIAISQNPSAS